MKVYQKPFIVQYSAHMARMMQVVSNAPQTNATTSITRRDGLKEGVLALKIAASTTKPRAPLIGPACTLHHGAAPSASPPRNSRENCTPGRRPAGSSSHARKM